MTEEESEAESVRERAQALRDRLAGEMDAPAEQDEQAVRRRATAEEAEGREAEPADGVGGTAGGDADE